MTTTRTTRFDRRDLAAASAAVLHDNDRGSHTVASPSLYPHQWSWDAAIITVGLARLSVDRAITELTSLLRAQWRTGMIPHIVFADEPGYFPGPDRWRTAAVSPVGVPTSGICQPPIHAIAVHAIVAAGRRRGGTDRQVADEFAASSFDALLRWHRWLSAARGAAGTGLIEIHHSWESGMDNSPRWDAPYAAVDPGSMPPYVRLDTLHVADAAQRPTDADYRRYLWLVEQMADAGWADDAVRESVDFRVQDVFFSALFAVASDVLAELGDEMGRHSDAADLRAVARYTRSAICESASPQTGLARDRDLRAGRWIDSQTVAAFAPLLCVQSGDRRADLTERFLGPEWAGHPSLKYALPPTTAPGSAQFQPLSYWRGPQWPIVSWLFWWAARRFGDDEFAHHLRTESLRQLGDGSFAEYYDPLTGAPLGSRRQSWTAAVALDWLASS